MHQVRLLKYKPNVYHHVTFCTKERKKVLVGEIKERVHFWFDHVARQYGFQLQEYNSWLDHCHMLHFVQIGQDLSYIMQVLKGVSARRIFEEFSELKLDMETQHLWGRRFYTSEVPPGALDRVREYIRQQEQIHQERMGLKSLSEWEKWQELTD